MMLDRRPVEQLLSDENLKAATALYDALAAAFGATEESALVEVGNPFDPIALLAGILLEARPDLDTPQKLRKMAEAFSGTVLAMSLGARATRSATGRSILEELGGFAAPPPDQMS